MYGMMQRIQQLEHQQHLSGLRPRQLFHEYARLPRSPDSLTREEVLKAFNASQSRGVASITAFARNLFRKLYTEDEARSGATITGNSVRTFHYHIVAMIVSLQTGLHNAQPFFKEACYSKVPVGISSQINYFPMLTVLEISFIAYKSCHESNCSLSRNSKFPLWPLEPRKLSS